MLNTGLSLGTWVDKYINFYVHNIFWKSVVDFLLRKSEIGLGLLTQMLPGSETLLFAVIVFLI